MKERWRPVVGFEGLYEVSDQGRVRSVARTVFVKPSVRSKGHKKHIPAQNIRPQRTGSGYLKVGLYADGASVNQLVHVLVLTAFRGTRPSGMQGAHNNGSQTDNRLSNLVWKTPVENAQDRAVHGTQVRGERHGSSKLTAEKVRALREQRACGSTLKQLARCFDISEGQVSDIALRQKWAHV